MLSNKYTGLLNFASLYSLPAKTNHSNPPIRDNDNMTTNVYQSNTGKLQNLPEISWFARVFGWFCVVLFENISPLRKCLSFDGLCVPMNCSEIGHSYEAFTFLLGQNIVIQLLSVSANKDSSIGLDLLKLSVTRNFG